MRTLFLLTLGVLWAQTTPPPTGLGNLQNLPMATGGVTLRTTTRLVDVSAVVVDKDGKPVTDLKKEAFEIYDEGKRQSIRLFSAPSNVAMEAAPATAPAPELPSSSRVFSNRVDQGSRPNVPTILLIDEGPPPALGAFAKFEEKLFARGRVVRFLKQLPAGEQVGLYAPLPDGVGIVHEFTRDFPELINVMEHWNLGPGATTLMLPAGRSLDRKGSLDAHFYCAVAPALIAITATADHVAGIPGRKTLIWFSLGGGTGSGPQNCQAEEAEAQTALNKANMALYAIDARGLQSVQPDAAIGPHELGCDAGCDSAAAVTRTLNTMVSDALGGLGKDQAVMLEMADKTGGRAFANNNDILGALRAPFTESHAAYALGFYPEDPHLDGKYHQLEVKIPGRPDLTVRFRRGYTDDADDAKAQLRTALWSPLDASAIALTAQMLPTVEGSYDVQISIGIDGLDLQQQNGRWQGRIHVILAQKDADGRQFDYRDDTVQLDLKPETYTAMRKSGLSYHQTVRRSPKSASLRIVVRDEAGNLGTVTIPQTQLLLR
jgi:VWFA-related protein